jgi:uncharacterized protein
MAQLLFFAASFLVLLLGHAALWYGFARFFGIISLSGRIISAVVIAVLFASTLVSSYLIHKWDNNFTRWYYMFAGFWIGLLANLALMVVLAFILKTLTGAIGWPLPLLVMKIILIGGTLLISLIGLYNAWKPKVTAYEVSIKDLPAAWEGKTVVQISDVHLGPVYRRLFFSRLIEQVNTLQPEAVFVTGDLFDGMESDFSWMNHPFRRLNAPRGTYYSFGNHDLYLGFDRVIDLLKENPVKILDNKLVVVDGLQIIGINYSFDSGFDLEEAILRQVGYNRAQPSILLFHAPKNVALAKSAEIDLQLSGHTHDGQIWPFNLVAKWAHQGYGYGLFTEGDFNLIVNGGAGTWGPPMRTSARSEIVKITLKKK